MKYLIILADGAADEPQPALGGKTPLMAADKPAIDRLAREGVSGRLLTVPEGYHPGSEIAHLGLLGYDVAKVFEGRGSLEAASMHIDIAADEVAMRCNLICLTGDRIKNHSSDNITTAEADVLIRYLQAEMPSFTLASGKVVPAADVRLFTGISYRHLLKIRGGNKGVDCTPPHDRIGQPWACELPRAAATPPANNHPTDLTAEETADLLRQLILWSQQVLPAHPVNQRRISEGKGPANSLWPWSLGYRPEMQTLHSLFPERVQTGAVISAVDLIFGIGVYCGLEKIEVEGATGLWDTNYEGKAQAALDALRRHDFVFLHTEATDEAGHDGNPTLKTRCVEMLDARVVRHILDEVTTWPETVRIALLPDHPTPCQLRTHTRESVPVVIWQSRPSLAGEPRTLTPDDVTTYDEQSARQGALGEMQGDAFIRLFLGA